MDQPASTDSPTRATAAGHIRKQSELSFLLAITTSKNIANVDIQVHHACTAAAAENGSKMQNQKDLPSELHPSCVFPIPHVVPGYQRG